MDFFTGNSVGLYFVIFFGKIIEVTVATLRIVLINRGERTKASIIAFFEILIWIMITGTVLAGFQSYPLKIVVFALAFALGNWIGSWLENFIALGLSTIQLIVNDLCCLDELLTELRANNVAVTVLDGEGRSGANKVLLIHLRRKRITKIVRLVNKIAPRSMITVSDVKVLHGGYIKK
ncbi:MAG: DUF2179 domain-containing protein [Christensenellales bacterium]|jgi:uncharacterized protein YebE (UPF0316 family)